MNKFVEAILVFVVIFCFGIFWSSMVSGIHMHGGKAIKALETQGFSHIKIIHKAIFFTSLRGGSLTDAARFTCIATNPAGKEVTIYVFCGWPMGTIIKTE